MTLEEKLAKIEELTEIIEGEEISLEKSLEVFEQCVVLAGECMETLNDCKGKLVVLQEKVKEIANEK